MFLLVLLLAAASSAENVGRIIGGSDAVKGSHPHQMSLQVQLPDRWGHACGAALIDTNFAITAAHCTDGSLLNNMRLVLNEHNLAETSDEEIIFGIAKKVEHENYIDNSTTEMGAFPNDVAVLQLDRAAPIENVARMANSFENFDRMMCTISGWGLTESGGSLPDILQEVEVEVLRHQTCRNTWGQYVGDGHICVHAPMKSACNGDSGGPLTCEIGGEKVVAGLASWVGYGCHDSSGNTAPSVYSRVSHFRQWFDAIVQPENMS